MTPEPELDVDEGGSLTQDDPRPLDPDADGVSEKPQATVLLACRDRDTRRWGVRWLRRFGFRVELLDGHAALDHRIAGLAPDVVVVEAPLLVEVRAAIDVGGRRAAAGAAAPRVIVVCANDRQVREVADLDVADVVRRPVNWSVVGRRIALIVGADRAAKRLEQVERQLNEAQNQLRAESERASRVDRVDRITGLPNSRAFLHVLERALAHRRVNGGSVAVLHVDLNRFSGVNELLGRRGGDEVLCEVARRLEATVRGGEVMGHGRGGLTTAVVARSTGVNFHLLVGNAGEPSELSRIARAVLERLAAPHRTNGTEIYVNPSVGLAIAPTDGDDGDRLLQCAESAMYEARRQGPGVFRFYNPSLDQSLERRMLLDRKLRRALELGEFSLHYQPLVELAHGRVVGVEALMRWTSPELGCVSPAEFIPITEDNGLMVGIGDWVLRTACRQLRDWLDAGMPPIRMSVNVSRCQLTAGGFADTVREALEESCLEPSLLVLELSERGVLGSEVDVLDQLRELKALGVMLAVDDFGTGNSAISYLRSLELDVLKIDRLYVSGLLDSDDDAAITSAMVAMAHELRLQVVAEGAEDEQQLERLRDWGCDEFQGFVFSPAVPADRFVGLVGELPSGSVGIQPPEEAS